MGFRIGFGKRIDGFYIGASKEIGGKSGGSKDGPGCLLILLAIIFFPITIIVLFAKWAYEKTQEQKAIDPDSVWYKQTWGIILMLILFFPVGLYLMFKYSGWNKYVKIAVTVLCCIALLVSWLTDGDSNSDDESSTEDKAVIAQETETESHSEFLTEPEEQKTEEALDNFKETTTENINSAVGGIIAGETTTTATTAATTKATTAATTAETTKQETQTSAEKLKVLYVTSPVGRNEKASLTIQGKPNTEYSISVFYSTNASKADGLYSKVSDSSGKVTWTWKVGGRTKAGSHSITVSGGGETVRTSFTTTE